MKEYVSFFPILWCTLFQLLKQFLEKLRTAYTTTATYLQKKLPLVSPTLMALSALDPALKGHSQAVIQLKKLSGLLSHLLPTSDIHQEIIRYNVDTSFPKFNNGDCVVEWWGHVFERRDKYPALITLVKCGLSIFHGPRVESSFSLMNEIIDRRSGNMKIATFNSIQTVRYALQAREKTAVELFRREDVQHGEVDRTLCRNILTAGTTDKQQRQQSLLEKRQLQPKSPGSVQESKRQLRRKGGPG